MDMEKKKHIRMDGYWRIYHLAHTREEKVFRKRLLQIVRRTGPPSSSPMRRRGRPPIHSWEKMVFLVALMVHLDCPLRTMESLAPTLKLPWHEPVPDHTTLHRAMKNTLKKYLEDMLAETVRPCVHAAGWNRKEGLMAADSSGVETDRYESAVIACRRRRRRRHLALHITAILDIMVVTAVQVTSSRTRDSPTLRRMVGQMLRTGIAEEVFGGVFNADRAYDADDNCRLIYELGSRPNIKQRKTSGSNRGKRFRRRAAEEFNPQIYRFRGLVEGIFGASEVKMHGIHTRCRLRQTRRAWGLLLAVGRNIETYNRLESAVSLGFRRKPILAASK